MENNPPTILIADDVKFNRSFIKMCLRDYGYRFLEAENGHQVLDQVGNHPVDLVILDLMMPIMDGFGCLAELKTHSLYHTIPIIINSSLEDLESVNKALALGCYDYFIKSLPQNELQIVLPLKVKNAIASKILMDQVSAQNRLFADEIEAAGTYQRFLLPQDRHANGLNIRQSYHPYLDAGGDFFDFVALPHDQTAFFIADVSGHGVLAAMVATLLKPLFERYIQDTRSPAQTLTQLNSDFLRLTDETKFITAFVAIYDPINHTLCYANAGHPPPIFLHRMTNTLDALKATGTLLGLFHADEWRVTELTLLVMPYDRLVLVTDGVIEATSPSGAMVGVEGLCQAIHRSSALHLDRMAQQLWQDLQDFTESHFNDDVTFIAIDFHDLEPSQVISLPSHPALVLATADEILSHMGSHGSPADCDAIKISLVEILMNAIEHGNLAIGYDQKQAALANGTFDVLVEDRLKQEIYASRLVTILYTLTPTYMALTIRDEGDGFDGCHGRCDRPPADLEPTQEQLLHGQGILIARTYMDHCVFHPPGNAVTLGKYFCPPLADRPATTSQSNDASTSSPQVTRKDSRMQGTPHHIANVTFLTLAGSVNYTCRKPLGEQVQRDLAQGHRWFILDLRAVTFIDSSGLGVLVACCSTIRKQDGALKLIHVPDKVRDLLEITKLTDFFELYPNAQEALQSVKA